VGHAELRIGTSSVMLVEEFPDMNTRAFPTLPFAMRRRRCGQMRGRRPGKTGGVFAGIH
jgi:uncharacterized glyoxalase superfamily protein PhnB